MRFKEAMDEERRKAAKAAEPKAPPKKDREMHDAMQDMKRRQNVDNKVRKLLGTGRSAR